ncbi:MAG: phenylalanine 4-monooxygenase [Acidimicrobiales bacterium]
MATRTSTAPVGLPAQHPGAADPVYCARRARTAEVGRKYRWGEPIPEVTYSPAEHQVWRMVSSELATDREHLACAEYCRAATLLDLPRERVPQLCEVDERLVRLTGFHITPVPGLVPTRDFYGALAGSRFLSTQYVRHPSVPRYTPEPDIIHEVIGHANALASPVFADLYRSAGRASLRAVTDDALEFLSRVFWFSIEFGVVWEDGELRAYGAGLLSSSGEIHAFRDAEIRPFDPVAMGSQTYDITRFQPVLFAAASFAQVASDLRAFFDGYDQAFFDRLARTAGDHDR